VSDELFTQSKGQKTYRILASPSTVSVKLFSFFSTRFSMCLKPLFQTLYWRGGGSTWTCCQRQVFQRNFFNDWHLLLRIGTSVPFPLEEGAETLFEQLPQHQQFT